jgi:PAS domain S-box-containing protein
MSLRLRINLLITVLMIVFAAALGRTVVDDARSSIHEEIEAGTKVTTQMLSSVVLLAGTSGTPRPFLLSYLERLGRVRANDIRFYDLAGARLLYQSPPSQYKAGRRAPEWYANLVSPSFRPNAILLPGARLEVIPEPSRATLDAWDDLKSLLMLGGLFFVAINVLVFWYVSRSLRPIEQIQEALSAMESGRVDVTLPDFPLPDLRRISEAFNRMARALGEAMSDNRRLALAVRQSSDAILIHDPDGRISFWNPAAERLFGYGPDDIVGKALVTLAPESRRDEVAQQLAAVIRREPVDHLVTRRLTRDAREIDVAISASPVVDPDTDEVVGGIVSCRDISAQIRTQAVENELKRNRELARVVETERRAIAQELHDELGQCVTAIRSIAEFVGQRSGDSMPDIHEAAQNIKGIAGRLYDDMHAIVRRLRPTRLEALGLADALRETVAAWAARHPAIEWTLEIDGDLADLGEAANMSIYRLAQEALTNVVRHADASRTVVTLARDDDSVVLSIRDNGHGNVMGVHDGGFGLAGMRERMRALGGSLDIVGKPEIGTEVRAVVPVRHRVHADSP